MHVIAEKRKWNFTISDKFISGALLWIFLLIAPSILVGFFSNCLNRYFELYTFLSFCVLVLFLFRVLRAKKGHLFPNTKLPGPKFEVYVLPILLFALLALFFHTFYLEYDAINVYFPYARSISLTGSMKYNVYDQSVLSTAMPPVLPVTYAWAFTTVNDLNAIGIRNDLGMHDLLRPIPTAYFLLTVLAIYLIARETSQKKYAVLSVIIFVSFPSVVLTLSAFVYYLDLSFAFYLVSVMLCLIRALKTRKPIWFLFTGVAGSLFLLAKEPSVFIIPLIFSIAILFSSIRYRRVIFSIVSTLPFYLVFFWDLHSSQMSAIGWILVRQLPVFALTAVLHHLSISVKKSSDSFTRNNLILLLIPFIPTVVFFSRSIVFLQSLFSIFTWGSEYSNALGLFNIASESSQEAIELATFLRWDIPFLSLGLGALYLIPISLSIIYLFKNTNKNVHPVNSLMLMMLFTLLETMSFWSLGSQSESRRLYYFAPILAIFAANGLMLFGDFLKRRYFIYLCMLFNSVAFCYIWLYRLPFQNLLGLSYLKKSVGFSNILDLTFFSLAFAGVFLVIPFAQRKLGFEYLRNSRAAINTRKRVPALFEPRNLGIEAVANSEVRVQTRKRVPAFPVAEKRLQFQNLQNLEIGFQTRKRIVYLSLLMLSCSMVVYPTIPLWLEGANKGFLSAQHHIHEPTYQNGLLFVSYYYNSHVEDDYVTVSFGGGPLRCFANRSVIDLATVIGVQSMQNILTMNFSADLLQSLNNSNIRYFLIPRSNNSFHHLYLGFRDNFYLFRFMEQDRHFQLVQEFGYYLLVRFEYS